MMVSERIRVLIVDDDRLVSMSLQTIVESDPGFCVVATGGSGPEAIALFDRLSPDILLMDIRMGGMTGLDAGAQILAHHPQSKILFLTTFADDEYIVRALRIGAKGYLLKQEFESIIPALRAIYSGQSVFGSDIVAKLPTYIEKCSGLDYTALHITDKEAEIIGLVAEGLNNREIAAKLFLSEGTVRNSLSVILEKLHLRDRTQLAIFYYKHRAHS